jgi:branched-subunit amino acid transport protein
MLDFDLEHLGIILGLAVVTVLSRGFFVLSDEAFKLPYWLERSLEYAPIAALLAVIAPEVLTSHGEWIHTWLDARWMACLAGGIYYIVLRKHNPSLLGVIVVGMSVYLPLHIWVGA